METLHEFTDRFSKSVGCYYHVCDSGIFSLKKVNSDSRGSQKVFAWVEERKRTGLFRIGTYKHLAIRAGVVDLADDITDHWGIPGVLYNVRKGSAAEDFQKAVRALRAILPFK